MHYSIMAKTKEELDKEIQEDEQEIVEATQDVCCDNTIEIKDKKGRKLKIKVKGIDPVAVVDD